RHAALQFLTNDHIDEGVAALRIALQAVGLWLPSTPRRAIWGLICRRLQLRLRGLSYKPRELAEIPAEELERLDTAWVAALGLGIFDSIRGMYFQTYALLLA